MQIGHGHLTVEHPASSVLQSIGLSTSEQNREIVVIMPVTVTDATTVGDQSPIQQALLTHRRLAEFLDQVAKLANVKAINESDLPQLLWILLMM